MGYSVSFKYDNETYTLPVNPEQIEVSIAQANEKYNILRLGQIVVPTHMELAKYSFETEFPYNLRHYMETAGDFKTSDNYLKLFSDWRKEMKPVLFTASNGLGEDINSLVLIEELTITEKAGEEGDKYVSFKLSEYRKFKRIPSSALTGTVNTLGKAPEVDVNPKGTGTYVVVRGDCLWAIAKKYYGDGSKYNKIVEANNIKNPSLIYPGQRLVIPQ